jgi:hypothetical protein
VNKLENVQQNPFVAINLNESLGPVRTLFLLFVFHFRARFYLEKNLPIQFERKFRTTLGCILENLFFILFTVGREKEYFIFIFTFNLFIYLLLVEANAPKNK